MSMNNFKISRLAGFSNKVILVDGFPGCGKTMLSPIISSFESVELMQYSDIIEQVSELNYLNKISDDVAASLIKINTDQTLYKSFMGRNVNCRPGDLSSIFRHKPLKYIKRMLQPGDELIPKKINNTAPFLHLATHMLFPCHNLFFRALKEKLIFIEVVRHPLYMIIQKEKNFDMYAGPRSGHIRYIKNDKEYTFFTKGWENKFDNSNSFEKAIYTIDWYFNYLFSDHNQEVIFVPFETFVKKPQNLLETISNKINCPISHNVKNMMRKQKVPRKYLSDGPSLDIYKRCGWEPPKYYDEDLELEARREMIAKNVNPEALVKLDEISQQYVSKFLTD